MKKKIWPVLSYSEGKDTYETIQLWTQIAGKIKIAMLPWINHSWHVTLYVTPFGFTTGHMPAHDKHFELNFDFINHKALLITSLGETKVTDLRNLSVAGFYKSTLKGLNDLGININISRLPNEIENPVPFDEDELHSTYDPEIAQKLHNALLNSNEVFTKFRSEFTGKSSPVHFFWGSFDLAVSRFSGRKAPEHPGGIPNLPDWVAREAYSHEVCSCGFWPGNEVVPFAAYYSYIYPEPEGYKEVAVKPQQAYYHKDLKEFILPYKAVQESSEPANLLLDFLNSTYLAAAESAHWDRQKLEKEAIL